MGSDHGRQCAPRVPAGQYCDERRKRGDAGMIAGLKGRIERKLDDAVLIDVGGVIYRVNTSLVTLEDIGETGENVRLFTLLYVREDQLTLYGFASPDELRLFETLISVSGVGPRLALSILSRVRPEALEMAINGENADERLEQPQDRRKTHSRAARKNRAGQRCSTQCAVSGRRRGGRGAAIAGIHHGRSPRSARPRAA